MLINIRAFNKHEFEWLMEIYNESNIKNIKHFYPKESDPIKGLEQIKKDHVSYIENSFLTLSNTNYFILSEEDEWVSALRFYEIDTGKFYIEALETHPEKRFKGYGSQLIKSIIEFLKCLGPFEMHSFTYKQNEQSLKTHFSCGFKMSGEKAFDFADNQYVEDDDAIALVYRYCKS